MSKRTIFHIDMDAFFAAIENAQNPLLKGKALIVGGLPDQRGVVSTCSYEARSFGVRSGMSLFEAKKRCPHAHFLNGNYTLYKHYSQQIIQILYAYTPYVEVVSIDEAYLDVSETVISPIELAHALKKEIFIQTQLTCSIGIAANKMIAKIAASCSKPNGLLEVAEGHEKEFLAPLDIGYLPGVGAKTEVILRQLGFHIIQDFQEASLDHLIDRYGSSGYYWHQVAHGVDNRPVVWEESPPKSIGAETTFDVDQNDSQVIHTTLLALCEKTCKRLKAHKMRARGCSLKLRDSTFHTISRSHTFETHINSLERLYKAATDLLETHYDRSLPLRLIGISLEKLTDGPWQPTFWDQ